MTLWNLGKVIDALYDSEINCSVSTFWDGGFTMKLGDEMNGFKRLPHLGLRIRESLSATCLYGISVTRTG